MISIQRQLKDKKDWRAFEIQTLENIRDNILYMMEKPKDEIRLI